jgi:hypothetical protein
MKHGFIFSRLIALLSHVATHGCQKNRIDSPLFQFHRKKYEGSKGRETIPLSRSSMVRRRVYLRVVRRRHL